MGGGGGGGGERNDQSVNFLRIIFTVAAYFYVRFNITCSYVLLLTTLFVYCTSLYLY